MKHRSGKAYEGWNPHQIATAVEQAIEDHCFLYAAGPSGELAGVVTCLRFNSDKTLYVSGILTTQRDVLAKFVKVFRTWFPGWKLEGERNGRIKHYDTDRFCNKVLKD